MNVSMILALVFFLPVLIVSHPSHLFNANNIFTAPPASAQSEDFIPLEYVIHISVDGLRGDFLRERLDNDQENRYPNFARLRQEGATTFNARTDDENTSTMPNHTSMITGRPVLRPDAFPVTAPHNYTTNIHPLPHWTLHEHGNRNIDYIASTFDVAKEQGLRTALYSGKRKFVIYEQSYNVEDEASDENLIDQFVYEPDTNLLVNQFLDEMEKDPFNYTFFHFRNPDTAGHDHGWGSEEWDTAVQEVDRYLGQMMDLVARDERLNGRTAIILTADHGGENTRHRDNFDAAIFTIPVFVWSPGNIPAGVDIYDLYALSFANPGSERVKYPVKPQPIRNGSTGNLALHLLGLPPVPGAMIDSPYFITHCGIESGKTYNFGETLAQIEVVQAGTEACISVGFVDTAETDYWRVIPYGEGYELNLRLPYDSQTVSAPEICPHNSLEGTACQGDQVSDTLVTRDGVTQFSEWTVEQAQEQTPDLAVEPTPDLAPEQTPDQAPEQTRPVTRVVFVGVVLLFLPLGIFYWRRKNGTNENRS